MCAGLTEVRCLFLWRFFLSTYFYGCFIQGRHLREKPAWLQSKPFVDKLVTLCWYSNRLHFLVGVGVNVLTPTIRCSNRSPGHCSDRTIAELPVARGYFSAHGVGGAWSPGLERKSICSLICRPKTKTITGQLAGRRMPSGSFH